MTSDYSMWANPRNYRLQNRSTSFS